MKKGSQKLTSAGNGDQLLTSAEPLFARGVVSFAGAENEARIASFVNQLPGFAWIKDLEGRYVYANSALQTLEMRHGGWVGKTDAELWPKEIAEAYRANDLEVITKGKPLETLEPYQLKGRYHVLAVSKFPIRDNSGAVILVGGAGFDVTERAIAEERLREYERVVEGLEEMIAVVDSDYRYLLANRAFLSYRRAKREDVVGRFIWEVVDRNVFEKLVKEKLDECLAGNTVRYEITYEYPHLGPRDLSLTYFPIQGLRGVDRVACILRDITEEKSTGIALNEAERKYREIFDRAGEGIFQSTPEGRFVVANPALAAMFGFSTPEEMILNCNDISRQIYVDPSRREEFIQILETQGVVLGFEAKAFRKNSSQFWMSINGRAVRDAGGRTLYYEGTVQDITERKRAELTSAAFASLARRLSGASTNFEAARIISEKAQKLFGWDACNLDLYDAKTDLVHPLLNVDTIKGQQVDVTPLIAASHPTARGRRVLEDGPELILRRRPLNFDPDAVPFGDKRRPAASIMSVPIKHRHEIVGLLSIQSYSLNAYDQRSLSDLVALAEHCGEGINRIRAEEAFRESKERYRELFENSKDAIYVHDLDGRYVSVNRAAEELSGYSRAEILGQHFSTFICPHHLDKVQERLFRKLTFPVETAYEAEIICKDGSRKPIEISSRMIYRDGQVAGIQGTARDITERKRAQEALQTYARRLIDAAEAERQNIALELHDEIGQVLTAVRLSLQRIQKTCQTDKCLPHVRDGIEIVDEALSRVRELSFELRPSLLDDLGLAAALRWYVSRYTDRTGIKAEVMGASQVRGIPQKVEIACFRIIQEALTNTARHSHATEATIYIERTKGRLRLTVSDNGSGFQSERLLDGLAASALGLRGMQERALAVDAQIEINSIIGKGTQVIVDVPLKGFSDDSVAISQLPVTA